MEAALPGGQPELEEPPPGGLGAGLLLLGRQPGRLGRGLGLCIDEGTLELVTVI